MMVIRIFIKVLVNKTLYANQSIPVLITPHNILDMIFLYRIGETSWDWYILF